MVYVWTPILERFNATSINLQSVDINLTSVVTFHVYVSLETYEKNIRGRFDVHL